MIASLPGGGRKKVEQRMETLERLSCNGIGTARGNDDAMVVYFNRPLTDDEINFFNNCISRWARFASVQYLGTDQNATAAKLNIPTPRAHKISA